MAMACLTACVSPAESGPSVTTDTSSPDGSSQVVDTTLVGEEPLEALLPTTPVTVAPEGEVRRAILDRQEFKLECFREHGFDGEIDDDMGILTDVPPDQQDRFFEINELCREAVAGEFGLTFGEPTVEELTIAFRSYLYVRECMILEGYPVDEPPSLDVYIQSEGAVWHPYNAFMTSPDGPTGLADLEETCPQDLAYLASVLEF